MIGGELRDPDESDDLLERASTWLDETGLIDSDVVDEAALAADQAAALKFEVAQAAAADQVRVLEEKLAAMQEAHEAQLVQEREAHALEQERLVADVAVEAEEWEKQAPMATVKPAVLGRWKTRAVVVKPEVTAAAVGEKRMQQVSDAPRTELGVAELQQAAAAPPAAAKLEDDSDGTDDTDDEPVSDGEPTSPPASEMVARQRRAVSPPPEPAAWAARGPTSMQSTPAPLDSPEVLRVKALAEAARAEQRQQAQEKTDLEEHSATADLWLRRQHHQESVEANSMLLAQVRTGHTIPATCSTFDHPIS
jgi:hypothetical protein